MAKSKRSKVKRKFRAIKRQKIAPKAAVQLKKILSVPAGGTGLPFVDASKIVITTVEKSNVESSEQFKRPKKITMNEHGNYPEWMNSKEMRRQIGKRKHILAKKRKAQRRK